MKRFYTTVSVNPNDDNTGYHLVLDGRPVKTPVGHVLHAPTQALAQGMAQEWDAQSEEIIPASMPLTSLAYTALDHIAGDREGIIGQIAAYGETDLLCYFAGDDEALLAKQHAAWQPILEWANQVLGVSFVTTTDLMPVQQADDVQPIIAKRLADYDDWRLAPMSVITALSGSIILGFGMTEGPFNAKQVFDASVIDETHQAERWGSDEEAEERRANIREEFLQAERFLELLAV